MKKYPVNEKGFSLLDEQEMYATFKKFPEIEKVFLFGSRAKGNFKKGSDIDLAIELSEKERRPAKKIISAIHDVLEEETNIPYFFDVINVHTISSVELKNHIEICGKQVY